MELGERKKMILQAIVEDYIATAEPVGSRNIAKNHDLGLSAATIRNEMADLEEMGFLDKPHTSAGRVPSQMGYRFYVDSLMHRYSSTVEEIEGINSALERKYLNLNSVISAVSDIVSKITKCPTVITMPTVTGSRCVNVKMLLIEKDIALIVVVLDGGSVRNKKVKVKGNITYREMDAISEFLNSQLAGLSVNDIDESRIMLIYGAMGQYKDFLKVVLEFVLECMRQDMTEVVVHGASNILNHPEFCNIDRAREFLKFIDNRANATKMLSLGEDNGTDAIKILIGDETGLAEMHDTSIVLANYHAGGMLSGKIGVIGPTRMDYARIVSSLETINAQLETILTHVFYDEE
ncbi:MAG: heat-inducible transcriptional repressor HrcA [Clostridia bacterium]